MATNKKIGKELWREIEEFRRMVEESADLCNKSKMFDNVNDPKRYSAPKAQGVYLIGNTLFNPHTNEQYYLVKVGESSNIYNRMKSYRTTNPMVFHIDFLEIKESACVFEHQCHVLMFKEGFVLNKDTSEWFLVNRETYLEICEKGFKYFTEKLLTE